MAKTINTRIQLKYDTLSNWQTNNPTLLAGEIACVSIGEITTDNAGNRVIPPIMMKVGPGAFNDLGWTAAKAADVYSWAKGENKPTYNADEIEGLAEFIGGKVEDSNDNTTYSFEIVDNNLVVKATPHTLGEAGEETVVATLALVSDAEFAEYKTANDAEVAKKLNAVEETGFVYSNGTTDPEARTDVITKDEEVTVGNDGEYLGTPSLEAGSYYAAAINIPLNEDIRENGFKLVKNDNFEDSDVIAFGNYDGVAISWRSDAGFSSLSLDQANANSVATSKLLNEGTITPQDLLAITGVSDISALTSFNIYYDLNNDGSTRISFYTVGKSISTSYNDLVLKVYENTKSTESLEDKKLNQVSDNGFLYSNGTNTPNVRTDVITLEENSTFGGKLLGTLWSLGQKSGSYLTLNITEDMKKKGFWIKGDSDGYTDVDVNGETYVPFTLNDIFGYQFTPSFISENGITSIQFKLATSVNGETPWIYTEVYLGMGEEEYNASYYEVASKVYYESDQNNRRIENIEYSIKNNLAKKSDLDKKLNKVSTNGFLYSDGTATPSARTDVITEQYRKLYKGNGEQLIDYNDSEYYDEEYNRIYSSWHSLPVYIQNISDSTVTVNCSLNNSSSTDPEYVYKSNVNNISILPGEGYLWTSVQEDYSYEGFCIDFTAGTPSQVVLYSEETEFKDINYVDLANQVSTNESNIATLTETVADHEERVTKVETFFETAEGETLDTALDTLVEIQKYITDEGSAADEMVKDIADHENRIKAIEDAPYATTANVATAKSEAIADAEGKVNALKTGVEDGTVVAAKATEASDYAADGAIDTAIKAASKAGTDAAAAVEAGVEDGTIVAAKATVADTANDLSAALDEEIAGLIATAKSGAEATAAADAKSKADAALAEAKAYAEGFEEVLIVDSIETYDGPVTKIGLSNKASYAENGNYNAYHSNIALVSEDNEITIKAISGQPLYFDGEKQNGTLNFGIRSIAASKVTGLADIATTGNIDDLVQTENTYITFDCGSSSVNI